MLTTKVIAYLFTERRGVGILKSHSAGLENLYLSPVDHLTKGGLNLIKKVTSLNQRKSYHNTVQNLQFEG